MPESNIREELEAIKTVSDALLPLKDDARKRVLAYVLEHLGIALKDTQNREPPSDVPAEPPAAGPPAVRPEERIVDIRSLRKEKDPTTDMQMAAIVAYYVSKLAPGEERKDCITADEINKYFEQGGHRIPHDANMTLNNAKNAGYLDRVGRGKFRLNPVGHNLVVHGLPKSADASSASGKSQKSGGRSAAGKSPKRAARKAAASKKKRKSRG